MIIATFLYSTVHGEDGLSHRRSGPVERIISRTQQWACSSPLECLETPITNVSRYICSRHLMKGRKRQNDGKESSIGADILGAFNIT